MSVLKWVGGKAALLSQLMPARAQFSGTYYEPFVGGASVLLAINATPQRCVAGDVNAALIQLYQDIQRSPADVAHVASMLLGNDCERFYYEMRQRFNTDAPGLFRSASLLYLNRAGYRGLYRENGKGKLNTPYGHYKNPRVCPDAIAGFKRATTQTVFRQGDYRQTCADIRPGDFVYFDPPYAGTYADYSAGGFGDPSQVGLRDYLDELSGRGIAFMLSNSDCEMTRDLYRRYNVKSVQAPSRLRNGTEVSELIVRNYD